MRNRLFSTHHAILSLLAFGLMAQSAHADCTSPTGVDGSYYTNTSDMNVYKCNGTSWSVDTAGVDTTKTPPLLHGFPRVGAGGGQIVKPCNVSLGAPCGGGFYAGDGNLVVAPAGCNDGTSPPTCPAGPTYGGVDTQRKSYSTSNSAESSSNYSRRYGFARSDSLNNGARPAFQYCRTMVYNGYSDWYLPTMFEMELVIQIFPDIGGVQDGMEGTLNYWTSNDEGTSAKAITPYDYLHRKGGYFESVSGSYNPQKTDERPVRCVRRN